MYKVPDDWKLSDFLELSNDEKLKWLYNGVKNVGGGEIDVYSAFAIPGDYSDEDVIDSETMEQLLLAIYVDGRPAVITVNFEDATGNSVYGLFATSSALTYWNCFAGDSTAIGSTLVVDTDESSETYGEITVTPYEPTDIFELKFTATHSNNTIYVNSNRTYAEFESAIQFGQPIIITLNYSGMIIYSAMYSSLEEGTLFNFMFGETIDSALSVIDIFFDSANNISLSEANYPLTPGE